MKNICALLMFGMVSIHGMQFKQIPLKQSECDPQYTASPNANPAVLMALGQSRISLINPAEVYLERSSREGVMNWLPALYDASGLSYCMSKECFMVNALVKIKEAITNEENKLACLRVCADLGGSSLLEDEQPYSPSLLFGVNTLVSGMGLLNTFLYMMTDPVVSVAYPRSIRITPVQTSCSRLFLVFNQTWGMDWYRECWDKSFAFNKPCNGTALGYGPTSFCCWDKVDPACNKQIVDYMNTTYPQLYVQADALHEKLLNQAKLSVAMPFYIAAPTVITLNLLFQLARYKYRRIMRERNAAAQELETIETV